MSLITGTLIFLIAITHGTNNSITGLKLLVKQFDVGLFSKISDVRAVATHSSFLDCFRDLRL